MKNKAASFLVGSHGKWLEQSLFEFGDISITPISVLKVAVVVAMAVFMARLAQYFIRKAGKKTQLLKTSSIYILGRLAYYFILMIGFIIALANIGFDLTTFALLFGAVAVWIGLSLQSTFHNFISGIIILLTRTVRLRDVIVLESGEVGLVADINLRTTILTTPDGLQLIVPNSELVTKKFTNRTLFKVARRLNIPFRLALDADKNFVREIVVEAAKKITITLVEPEPALWITGYGDNFLKCELAVWVNEHLSTYLNMSLEALYFTAVDDALRANQIKIPVVGVALLQKEAGEDLFTQREQVPHQ